MTRIDIEVLPARNEQGLIAPGPPSIEDFRKRIPDVADSILEIATAVQTTLDAGDQPEHTPARWAMDGVQLAFEMALEAGGGVIIAKASASAKLSIQITWKRSA